MNKEIKNKLQRGLALTVKESQDLYKYIKALDQEPCEDVISRQAVLNAIMANNIWENEYNLTSSRIKKAVENLPSVNPQEPNLDKIRAEIDRQEKWLLQAGYTAYNTDIAFDSIKRVIAESEE